MKCLSFSLYVFALFLLPVFPFENNSFGNIISENIVSIERACLVEKIDSAIEIGLEYGIGITMFAIVRGCPVWGAGIIGIIVGFFGGMVGWVHVKGTGAYCSG